MAIGQTAKPLMLVRSFESSERFQEHLNFLHNEGYALNSWKAHQYGITVVGYIIHAVFVRVPEVPDRKPMATR